MIPTITATSDPGDGRRHAPQDQDERQRRHADQQRQPLGLTEFGDQIPELLKEVT
jgi:hypothetical protein